MRRIAWWVWRLHCFACLFVVMVNGCPDRLWNLMFRRHLTIREWLQQSIASPGRS
jgi:hypothetical protein